MAAKKEIASNSIMNILAAAVPLVVLQLFVLPKMNAQLGADTYGLVVTLISLFTLFPFVFGNTLNNVRLINDLAYQQEGLEGDFNVLACVLCPISMVLTGVVGIIYIGSFGWGDFLGLCIVASLFFFDSYYSVGFLINLNYRKVLVKNIIKTTGHIFGFLLFLLIGYWYWVYIIGYAFACIYLACSTSLVKEPLCVTVNIKKTTKDELVLLASSFLANVTTYADRLLLYPLLGGASVAVYYASTLLGKLISLTVGPVSNVLLATLGRSNKIQLENLRLLLLSAFVFSAFVYFVCIVIARPVIGLLYPDLVDAACALIAITCATSVVNALNSLVNPIVLRFCSTAWQFLLCGVKVALYVGFSLSFLHLWGLMGFAVGVLVSEVVTFVIRLVIISVKRNAITGEQAPV